VLDRQVRNCLPNRGRSKGTPLAFALLSVYYWLPHPIGLAHLFISAVLLVLAWRHRVSLAKAWALLFIYTAVWVIFVAYVVWWYVTKQEFGYI
jgi:hypothetical protein